MNLNRLLAICVFSLAAFSAQAATPVSTDRLIVKWHGAGSVQVPASAERVRGLAGRLGKKLIHGRNIGGGMSVLQLDTAQQGAALNATLQALRADPDVEFVEVDRWVRIGAYTPNDPLFTDVLNYGDATHPARDYQRQWYLKSGESGEIASIRADSAWDITRGATTPIVVAVVDTGVRPDHPDLVGRLLPGFDFVSTVAVANDSDGWDSNPSDPGDYVTLSDLASPAFIGKGCVETNSSWHGTRVSGLIGAHSDNAVGIASVGFNVRILPVRALGKCGGNTSDVIAAMYWAAGLSIPPPLLTSSNLIVNANPAQIINMSLGSEDACGPAYSQAVSDITAHGVLVVASAGNEGLAVGSPASCAGALAVAGLRHAGTKVGYSSLGPEVGIAAPAGNCVFVLLITDPCVFSLNSTTNNGTQAPVMNTWSSPTAQPTFGTSFSSPLVAGTASLMKAVNPALTPAMLVSRIRESARAFPTTSIDATTPPPACALPTTGLVQNAECICNTQVCGAGMLDAHGAVQAAQRPAVFASLSGSGQQRTLDGSRSAASTGRVLTSFQWSVVSISGGATNPVFTSPTQAITTVTGPTTGSAILRLTVTDNLGGNETAQFTITGSGGSSTSPPPPPAEEPGGGGSVSLLLLLLAALLLLARQRVVAAGLRR